MIESGRVIGFVILAVFPGAIVTFSLPLRGLSFWVKLLAGVALTPLVLCVQFYAVRLLGVPFERTAILLAALNSPAAYLIYRQRPSRWFPDRRLIAEAGLALLAPFACLAPQLLYAQARAYSGHAWMHADIVYMIANGELLLDDPELVGVRLDYYWAGHVYQAILSHMLGSPPVSNYIWTNILFLLITFAFVAAIVAELGGQRFARLSSIIWLCFGVNFVGYSLGQLVRSEPYGDPRYTPWLFYFLFFHQITIAIGVFAAALYLLIKAGPEGFTRDMRGLLCLLLCCLGIIYPILLPPIVAVVAGLAVALLIDHATARSRALYQQLFGLFTVVLIAGAVTAAQLHFLTRDRVAGTIHLHSLNAIVTYARTAVVVTSPLLAGLCLAVVGSWRTARAQTITLALGGLASCALYAVLDIPPGEVQYKYIFAAAICLAPFPSVVGEAVLARFGRLAVPVAALATCLLAAPFAHKIYRQWPWGYRQWGFVYPQRPRLDLTGFDLRLADGEPSSGLFDAIRRRTPMDSLLVLPPVELHFPALTRRRLFVPSAAEKAQPGVNVVTDHLLTVLRGYDANTLEERRAVVRTLYTSTTDTERARSLDRLLQFHHPVAIVMYAEPHARLREWLTGQGIGTSVYQADGVIVWLVEPSQR